jgi:hypothetical protein
MWSGAIKPNMDAAHRLETLLELRSHMATDVQQQDGSWSSKELSRLLNEGSSGQRGITYPDKLRRQVFGDHDQYRYRADNNV